jgi:hypothetical protein
MHFRTGAKCAVVAVGLLVAGLDGARADVYEYTYTPSDETISYYINTFGNLTYYPGPFISNLQFSFEVAEPIPANVNSYSPTLLNWTFGPTSVQEFGVISSDNYSNIFTNYHSYISISTNNNGNVDG